MYRISSQGESTAELPIWVLSFCETHSAPPCDKISRRLCFMVTSALHIWANSSLRAEDDDDNNKKNAAHRRAVVQEPDEDMFWDYAPPAATKSAAALELASDHKSNGTSSSRPQPSPEKVSHGAPFFWTRVLPWGIGHISTCYTVSVVRCTKSGCILCASLREAFLSRVIFESVVQ